jgi:ribosomal protein L40E
VWCVRCGVRVAVHAPRCRQRDVLSRVGSDQ